MRSIALRGTGVVRNVPHARYVELSANEHRTHTLSTHSARNAPRTVPSMTTHGIPLDPPSPNAAKAPARAANLAQVLAFDAAPPLLLNPFNT